jgi:hypothetical protein
VAQAKKEGQRKTAALLNFEGIATFRGEQLRGANGRKRQQQLQALCLKNEHRTANFCAEQLCTIAGPDPGCAVPPSFSAHRHSGNKGAAVLKLTLLFCLTRCQNNKRRSLGASPFCILPACADISSDSLKAMRRQSDEQSRPDRWSSGR